jgi:hypothetical protein
VAHIEASHRRLTSATEDTLKKFDGPYAWHATRRGVARVRSLGSRHGVDRNALIKACPSRSVGDPWLHADEQAREKDTRWPDVACRGRQVGQRGCGGDGRPVEREAESVARRDRLWTGHSPPSHTSSPTRPREPLMAHTLAQMVHDDSSSTQRLASSHQADPLLPIAGLGRVDATQPARLLSRCFSRAAPPSSRRVHTHTSIPHTRGAAHAVRSSHG